MIRLTVAQYRVATVGIGMDPFSAHYAVEQAKEMIDGRI
jgi:hypothetical protein